MDHAVVFGFLNPVRCAEEFLKRLRGVSIDQASFDRVATVIGNAPAETLKNGFVVRSLADIQRLCEIGQFVIETRNGVAYAMLPSEYQPTF